MTKTAAALLVLLPAVAAALPAPAIPEIELKPTPFTLVENALEQQPKYDFAPRLPAPRPTYVDLMPVVVPGAQADRPMVHAPDPAVDYKLAIVDPAVAAGK